MLATLGITAVPVSAALAQSQNSMQISPVYSCADTTKSRRVAAIIVAACGATVRDGELPTTKRLAAAKRWLEISRDMNVWSFSRDGILVLEAYYRLEPHNVLVKLMIARHRLNKGRIAEAVIMANEVLENDANNGIARLIRGTAEVWSDDSYTDISDHLEAVRLLPDRHEPLMELGRVMERRFKRFDKAAELYSRAMAINDVGSNAYSMAVYGIPELAPAGYGRMVLKTKSPEVAVDILTDLLTKMPKAYKRTHLLELRLLAYRRSGDTTGALADLNEILGYAFDHQKPDLLLRRAFLKRELKLYDEAVADIALATASGNLKMILQLQVKLRNAGETSVEINGEFDAATKAGLISCMSNKECGAILGTPI